MPSAFAFTIAPAVSPAELDAVRALFREYVASVGADPTFRGIAAEIECLPGRYVPPRGALLLASQCDGVPAGFAAMRPIDLPNTCELKRQYVRPGVRGLELGRRLVLALLERAWCMDYRHIVLDTRAGMVGARHLYAELGFRPIPAYNSNPLPGTRYLGLDL